MELAPQADEPSGGSGGTAPPARDATSVDLDALRRYTGVLSHDLNNVLQAIRGFAALGADEAPEGSVTAQCFAEIRKSSDRAVALMNHLQSFSGEVHPQEETLDALALAAEAVEQARAEGVSKAPVILVEGGEVTEVRGDRRLLGRLVFNLVQNALLAMHGREGDVRVEVRSTAPAPSTGEGPPDETACGLIEITVTDQGAGMDSGTVAHAFDPLFSRRRGRLGLGLTVAKMIADAHGATLALASVPGEGTRATLRLPARMTQGAAAEAAEAPVLRRRGVICFIDDERNLAQMVSLTLARAGFLVEAFEAGAPALERLRQDPDTVALIVCDLVMPGMGGEAICREASRIAPEVPFVLCSGHVARMRRVAQREPGVRDTLSKPFDAADLLAFVSRYVEPPADA